MKIEIKHNAKFVKKCPFTSISHLTRKNKKQQIQKYRKLTKIEKSGNVKIRITKN